MRVRFENQVARHERNAKYRKSSVATTVKTKGLVTLPKSVPEAAGIHPGDRVVVRARPEGGVILECESAPAKIEADRKRLEAVAHRRPLRKGPLADKSTDEIMDLLRGED